MQGILGERLQEVLGEGGIEVTDTIAGEFHPVDQVRAIRNVDGDLDLGLGHRQDGGTEATNPLARAQRLADGVSQGDPDVLDGVVQIDLEISLGGDLQIEEPVLRKRLQHVVEEGNPGRDVILPRTIEHDFDLDVCLLRLADDGGGSGICGVAHGPLFSSVREPAALALGLARSRLLAPPRVLFARGESSGVAGRSTFRCPRGPRPRRGESPPLPVLAVSAARTS